MSACEIHVPISARPGFMGQLHLLAASLRRWGGKLADATIHVTVSRDRPWQDLSTNYPWTRNYPIVWRWMTAASYERSWIFGTALDRFTYDFEAPFVVMLDSDILCTGPLDQLLELGNGALAGLIAHTVPRKPPKPEDQWWPPDAEFWQYLYGAVGLPEPELKCQYSGWGIFDTEPEVRWCPPYFNHGVLAGTRDVIAAIGEVIYAEREAINKVLKTQFQGQLAVTVALERLGLPWRELPLRFNFPNVARFCDVYPQDAADIRILHYLKTHEIDRWNIATSVASLDAFLARTDLSPPNKLLQDRVGDLREELEPELPVDD